MPFNTFGITDYTIGRGAIESLAELAGERVGLVVDDGVVDALGLMPRLEEILRPAAEVKVLCHMQTEPTRKLLAQPIKDCQEFEPTVLVAIGGGSTMDSAKVLWLFYELPDYDWERACRLFQVDPFPGKCRLIAIPTTSGTGSETTCCAMADKGEEPAMILAPQVRPTRAIIDYDLLASLPKSVIAFSGMDALSHAIGATTINWASELVRQTGLQAATSVIYNLVDSYNGDQTARQRIAVAATLAGASIDNSNCGLAHSIDQAGGEFHIPHGLMQAINMPYVLRVMGMQPQYVDLGRQVGLQGSDEEVYEGLIAKILEMCAEMNIPTCLKDAGVPEDEFLARVPAYIEDTLANPALDQHCHKATREELEQLYKDTYYGVE